MPRSAGKPDKEFAPAGRLRQCSIRMGVTTATVGDSIRLDRSAYKRLIWAVIISLAVHLAGYGGYELNKRYAFLSKIVLPSWLQKALAEVKKFDEPKIPTPPDDTPLTFIEVPANIATPTPPPNAKYYSDKNTVAGNPNPDKDTGVPKIDGTQTEMIRTEDVLQPRREKPQPVAQQAPEPHPDEHAAPRTAQPVGDLVMANPELNPRQDTGTAEKPRPRTIAEALARQPENTLVGRKMKTDGGVGLVRLDAGFDTAATPFGAYDQALIDAVQDRWYALIGPTYDGRGHGKVVISFRLNDDGTITDAKVLDSNVDEILSIYCQKAITDPSPFDKWTREMRLKWPRQYRDLKFTFYYL